MIFRPGSVGVSSEVFLDTDFDLLVVVMAEVDSASSSSSPNDSLLFANVFFFFLGRPSEDTLAGVDALFFVYQWRWSIDRYYSYGASNSPISQLSLWRRSSP